MDELSRCILEVFDELGQDTLDLHALMEVAGGSNPGRRDNVPGAVELLVRSGALDPAGGGDVYRRSEQGRLAVAKPRAATLYSRPKCHLCDEARAAILPILREFGAPLHEVNIDDDKELRELYTDDVPVIFLGSREVTRHQVDTVRFRKALEDAKS